MISWCFESLSHMKAVEMQAVLLKTSFVVIFQCTNTLWCHINILFVDILTILMYLFQFLLSYNSKQLSTFHLPFGGDENVLAKDLAPWPKVWNPRFLSSYRLVFVFFRIFLKINILEIHYLTLLLQSTSNDNAPLLASTPTVRGHAEACPSTTYAKCPVPRSHYR